MSHTIGNLRGAFLTEHDGQHPTAFRIHPGDWYKLLSEVSPSFCMMDDKRKFMGMFALVDPSWMRGFPICVSAQGAAEAIKAGARQG